MPRQYHEAGIYMVRNIRTGKSYIGASCQLTTRLMSHRSVIRNQSFSWLQGKKFIEAFTGFSEDDVEFRILERVKVCATEKTYGRGWEPTPPGIARLYKRELYWIQKLKPYCNTRGLRKPFCVDDLPVGPPPEMNKAGAA